MITWVAGKGGVGRTSVAAALTVCLADEGRRVVLLSAQASSRLTDPPPTATLREVRAEERWNAFRERFGAPIEALLSSATFFDGVLARSALSLRPPALEAFGWGEALLEAIDEGAHLVVDAPATGHLLPILDGPEHASAWLDAVESIRDRERYLRAHFGDETKTSIDDGIVAFRTAVERLAELRGQSRAIVVVLRQPAVIAETERLVSALTGRVSEVELLWNRDPAGAPEWPEPLRGASSLRRWWASRGTPSVASPPPPNPRVLQPLPSPRGRVVWVAGPGGAGKTTTACALACHFSATGERTLLANLDPADSIPDVLGRAPGPDGLARFSADGKSGVKALRDLLAEDLEEASDRVPEGLDLPFDSTALQALLDAAPAGLDELLGLWQLGTAVAEEWDRVVIDNAPDLQFLTTLRTRSALAAWRRWLQAFLVTNQRLVRLPRLQHELRGLRLALSSLDAAVRDGEALIVTRPDRLDQAEVLASKLHELGLPLAGVVVQAASEVTDIAKSLQPTGWVSAGAPLHGHDALATLGQGLFVASEVGCPEVA